MKKIKMSIWNTRIMKKLKYLFAIQELWFFFLQYMNYEIKKMFVCNTWIIKMFVLIIQIIQLQIMKIWKYLFARHELWKHENVHLKHKNYEKVKIFVCNTGIMKIFCLQYMNNENIKMFVCNTRIMKKCKYCCQYMNYENIF